MNDVNIEQLAPIKIPLIKRFYKEHYPSGKPNKSEQIFTISLGIELCGVVRFRHIETFRLLTGMTISTELRGRGLGHQLMNYCQQHCLSETDFCFAYSHLESFYTLHGFTTIPAIDLPNCLKTLYDRYCNSGKDLIPMHYQNNC